MAAASTPGDGIFRNVDVVAVNEMAPADGASPSAAGFSETSAVRPEEHTAVVTVPFAQ